jgi:hypothetical protein
MRVEVVLLVVVQRLFFAETIEHRVWIGVEVDVVGVVVDIPERPSTDRHGAASRRIKAS